MENGLKRSKAACFFRVLFSVFGSVLLILGLLIVSIEMFAVNQNFFDSEYTKLNTAKDIGINEADLDRVTQNLLDYTTGKLDSLDMEAEINGEVREVFDAREKAHMVDVKALYLSARSVRTVSLISAAVLIVLVIVIGQKKALKTLCKSFLWVSGGFLIVVAAIAAYAAVDFNSFWTSFHYVFFPGNDLWQLYDYEVLIQMVPERFFSDLVARIIIRFVSIFLTLNIAAAIGLYINRKRQRRAEAQGA